VKIDPDSFEEWQAHPITEALMKALEVWEQSIVDLWLAYSIEAGQSDPIELARHRERIRAYRDIRAITSERIEELINDQGS
jgi:hypothetical protein